MTLDVTIITGMSGAGRSAAADVLEDLGFFVIDNLPPALITKVRRARRAAAKEPQRFGARRRRALGRVRRRPRRRARRAARAWARAPACCSSTRPTTCSCAATRRAAASTRSRPTTACPTASPHERGCSKTSRAEADLVVDTSDLNVHELRDRLRELFDDRPAAPARCRRASCRSATSTGCPLDVDLVFDCRFLPNPHWVDELRPLTGHRRARARLRARAAGDRCRSSTSSSGCSRCCCPAYVREGKSYLSIGDRLHRRPPPQRRDRRPSSAGSARAARRVRRACTTGTSSVS